MLAKFLDPWVLLIHSGIHYVKTYSEPYLTTQWFKDVVFGTVSVADQNSYHHYLSEKQNLVWLKTEYFVKPGEVFVCCLLFFLMFMSENPNDIVSGFLII